MHLTFIKKIKKAIKHKKIKPVMVMEGDSNTETFKFLQMRLLIRKVKLKS